MFLPFFLLQKIFSKFWKLLFIVIFNSFRKMVISKINWWQIRGEVKSEIKTAPGWRQLPSDASIIFIYLKKTKVILFVKVGWWQWLNLALSLWWSNLYCIFSIGVLFLFTCVDMCMFDLVWSCSNVQCTQVQATPSETRYMWVRFILFCFSVIS